MGTGSKKSIQRHEFCRIHQAWPSQRRSWLDTRWALFSGHLIRGLDHSISIRVPTGWLCLALLSFLSIHNGELPSSNPNLFYRNDSFTPSHNRTCSALLPSSLITQDQGQIGILDALPNPVYTTSHCQDIWWWISEQNSLGTFLTFPVELDMNFDF